MIAGFDTETHLIKPGMVAPRLVCGTVATELSAKILDREQTLAWYRNAIRGGVHLVGVNIAYDLGVLCAEDRSLIKPTFAAVEAGQIHDVSLREALADIGRGALSNAYDDDAGIRYSLAFLVQRYFGEDISADKSAPDAWRLRYAELDGVPLDRWPWAAIRYPLRDACFPLEIYQRQEGLPNLHDEYRQIRAAWALHLMALWGLRTSRPRVAALKAQAEAQWTETREELGKAGIFRPDGTKDMARVKDLVTMAYSDNPPTTPSGEPATDRDTLLESGHPILIRLGNAGKNDKRITTYIPMLERGLDVPWNPMFNTLVATGRASSDAQQFPTGKRSAGGIRECFDPRPGYGYSSCDYPGLELFTMAQRGIKVVGFSQMAEFLKAGKDCHCHVAAQFMNKAYDEVLAHKAEKPYEQFRDLAKIFNFGKGGGMGAGAMAYNAREKDNVRFCLTTGECTVCGEWKITTHVKGKDKPICGKCVAISKRLGAAWLEAWPEQAELFRLAGEATAGGVCSVEVPYSGRVRGGCRYTQWLNTPFQGLGGDLAKDALWRVCRECYCDETSPLYGSRPVLFVHDEIICEHPLDVIKPAAERVAQLMNQSAVDWLPDVGGAVKVKPKISMTLAK